jgi:hypothetical protein
MKDILDLRDIADYSQDLKKQNRKKNGRPSFFQIRSSRFLPE